MQIQGSINSSVYKNSLDASLQIARKEGIKGMFASAHAAIARDAPFAAIYFTTYEVTKNTQKKYIKEGNEGLNVYNNLLSGAIAGGTASIATNPIDVVKTYE